MTIKNKLSVVFVASFFLCVLQYAFAQTGPAGVGTSSTNVLWLKADKGTSTTVNNALVSTWNDQSGNGIHVAQTATAQQPSFATNVLNGFPALQFDNVSGSSNADRMIAPDNPKLDNTSHYSFFNVVRMNFMGPDARAIVSKRTSIDIDEAFMLFFWTSNYFYVDIDGLGDRYNSSPVTYTTNTGYILNAFYNGTLAAANRSWSYQGETHLKTATETSTLVNDKPSPLNIACTHSTDGRPFGGYISEIIIYTITVNPAQRMIVNNYLSSKYNISLSANDYYAGDTPANGNYDYEVAGVGKLSTGSNPSFSASVSGGIGISTTGVGFDDGDFILAGHATFTNSQIMYDVSGMTGTNNARWERVWYVDVTNTGSNIQTNIEFDMSDGGVGPVALSTPSNYVLIYRPAQTGAWTELMTASTIVGDRVIFNGFTFVNDGYYTIGTKDHFMSPLPVQFLDFNLSEENKKVVITWKTASEKNCSHYEVQKYNRDNEAEKIVETKCKGISMLGAAYSESDEKPVVGQNYYRVVQRDYDGQAITTPWKSIYIKDDEIINVYPASNSGVFYIETNQHTIKNQDVLLYNSLGQKVEIFMEETYPSKAGVLNQSLVKIEMLNPPPSGIYYLKINCKDSFHTFKLIVNAQ